LVNPPHRLAAGPEQQDGAVVDDDLYLALVVFDDKLGVLDGAPALGVAVGAGEGEEVSVNQGDDILGGWLASKVIGGRCLDSRRRFTNPLR